MFVRRSRRQLAVEVLEDRMALSGGIPVYSTANSTISVLQQFAKSYLSKVGQPNYHYAFDFTRNGQIGQTDAKILLHELPPAAPKIPITLNLTLALQDKARGHVPTNLGGVTHTMTPTVLGHTSPGAIIFSGSGVLDLKLRGPMAVADSHGNFSFKLELSGGINQEDFQAVDHYGQQILVAFPIYWLGYSAYKAAHPVND